MKSLILLTLASCAILFSQCKTTVPTDSSKAEPSLLEVQQILDTTSNRFLQYADSTNGNQLHALTLTANWVQSLPNVQSVSTIDSTYLLIVMKSGLQTNFYINMVNGSKYPIFRGERREHP